MFLPQAVYSTALSKVMLWEQIGEQFVSLSERQATVRQRTTIFDKRQIRCRLLQHDNLDLNSSGESLALKSRLITTETTFLGALHKEVIF